MAFKLNYQKNIEGFSPMFAMSYCRVDRVNAGKDNGTARVMYLSENKSLVLGVAEFSFVPSVEDISKNFIAQAYDYLKTLPEFANAVDC
jgi:hypothetical protein